MGILKQIQEQDERNTTTEILPDLISRLDSVEQHLSKLTKHHLGHKVTRTYRIFWLTNAYYF